MRAVRISEFDRLSVGTVERERPDGAGTTARIESARVVAGWFDGVTTGQLTAAATACLRGRNAFVLQWWGLAEVLRSDYGMVRALETGERATKDAEYENVGSWANRQDWVVTKALAAHPISFLDFVSLGATQEEPTGTDV